MDESKVRELHSLQGVLGAKWTLHVIRVLDEEPRGFNDLRRALGGITAKTLSARLSELRCLCLVEKEIHPTSPPTTTYRLTDHGADLARVLDDLRTLVDGIDCPEDCPDEACPDDCPVPVAGTAACADC